MSIWLAKVLSFSEYVKIHRQQRFKYQGLNQLPGNDMYAKNAEICFIKFHEVLNERDLNVNQMDSTLVCTRL